MRKGLIFTIMLLITSFVALAQHTVKNSFFEEQLMLQSVAENEKLHLYVKAEKKLLLEWLANNQGSYKYDIKNFQAIVVPKNKYQLLKQQLFISEIKFEYNQGVLLADTMLSHIHAEPIHQGEFPFPSAYEGSGIVMGFIDSGVDFNHPDFKDENGKTRILHIWDQRDNSLNNVPQFGYGRQWDSTSINNLTCLHTEPSNQYGHGTGVVGIGAGNGLASGNYSGVAPKSDIIVVATNFSASNWTSTVADAVAYIFHKADSLGKPCVINTSLGTYSGSHDGRDMAAQIIDSLIKAKEGRVVVAAAGNSGDVGAYHLSYEVPQDTAFTWFKFHPSINYFGSYTPNGAVYFAVYADTADFNQVYFSIGADKTSTNYQLRGESQYMNVLDMLSGLYNQDANNIYLDSINNTDGDLLAKVYYDLSVINDSSAYLLYVVVDADSTQDYLFRFSTFGEGKFSIWSKNSTGLFGSSPPSDMVDTDLPEVNDFATITKYRLPDSSQSIVSSWVCLPSVITVGNFVNRTGFTDYNGVFQSFGTTPVGQKHPTSSVGPNRLGDLKPNVIAPGHRLLTTSPLNMLAGWVNTNPEVVAPDGLHRTANGTSAAAPVVSGIAALLLERCAQLNYLEVMDMLQQSAKQDVFTSGAPNSQVGFGKANAYQAMTLPLFSPKLTISGEQDVCQAFLLSTQDSYPLVYWSTNNAAENIYVTANGIYSASVINTFGCLDFTDTLSLTINPYTLDTLSINFDTTIACFGNEISLSLPNNYNYIWSNGNNQHEINVTQSGNYFANYYNSDGCIGFSDTLSVTFLITPPKPTITNKADTMLISSAAGGYQWYLDGELLAGETNRFIYPPFSGNYYVNITHANGCENSSDELYVDKLNGLYSFDNDRFVKFYPNPASGVLVVESPIIKGEIALYDLAGKLVFSEKISSSIQKLNLEHIPSGTYFVVFEEKGEFYGTQKLIVIK
jgi:hypothetical protein